MKKVNRGFIFYLLIFFGILLASFLLCVVILIFSPGTTIFGITYYKEDDSKSYQNTVVYNYMTNSFDDETLNWFDFDNYGVYEFNVERRDLSKETSAFVYSKSTILKIFSVSKPKNLPDSTVVKLFKDKELVDPEEGSYKIENGEISFNASGEYVIEYSVENVFYSILCVVSDDLTCNYYDIGESILKFNLTDEQLNLKAESIVAIAIQDKIELAASNFYKIENNEISFNVGGDFIIQLSGDGANDLILCRVNEDLSFKCYKYVINEENTAQNAITKIEYPNIFNLDSAKFTSFSNGEFIVYGNEVGGSKQDYKVIINDETNLVYKLVEEPKGITGATINGIEDTSNIFKIENGEIVFISESVKDKSVYEITISTETGNTAYRVEVSKVGNEVEQTFYVKSQLPSYISEVCYSGIHVRTAYYELANTKTQLTDLNISTIQVVSNAHNVTVKRATPTDENSGYMRVFIDNKSTGFTTEDIKTSSMDILYYSDVQRLEIYATIPEGFWATSNNSSITIRFPTTSLGNMLADFNFDIDAGNGSVSFVSEPSKEGFFSTDVEIGSLSVKTSGDLIIGNTFKFNSSISDLSKLGKINLDVGSLKTSTPLKAKNITIKSIGNISLNVEGDAILSYGDVIIETQDSFADYGNITISDSFSKFYLKNIYGEQNFKSINRDVVISNESKNCDYYFENIYGNINAGESATEEQKEIKISNCNITINSITGIADIHTTGKISIPE